MNIARSTKSTATKTSSTKTSSTARKIRNLGLIAALAIAGLIGVEARSGSEASAATAVSFCFQYRTGQAYGNQPVFLYRYQGRATTLYRSGRTKANGCATFFNTPSNVNLVVQARAVFGDTNIGQAVYMGQTNYYSYTGAGTADLGRALVSRVSCVSGLYRNICPNMPL